MRRWLLAVLVIAAMAVGVVDAQAAWNAAGSGSGSSKAQSMPAGNTPVGSAPANSNNVTVVWAASSGTVPVAGYVVKRYNATTNALQTTLANCAGTVAGTSCTENGVPNGSWRYTVTPKQQNWLGTESAKGNTVVINVDATAPQLTALEMFDIDIDGKVDRVVATFDETLATPYNPGSSGRTGWTLSAIPSSGTLSSVTVSGAQATLNISEGGGAQNTAVGSFTVALTATANGIRDAAGNLSSFGATSPADKASPVVVSIASSDGDGMMEAGDVFDVTFSEALAAVPSTTSITESDPSGGGNDTLAITGLTSGARNTGSDLYVNSNNRTATFSASTLSLVGGNQTVRAIVAGSCSGDCGNLAAGQGALQFAPSTSITDPSANAAAGSLTAGATFRIF